MRKCGVIFPRRRRFFRRAGPERRFRCGRKRRADLPGNRRRKYAGNPSPQAPKALPGTTATFFALEQFQGERLAGHAEFRDVGEDIERALGFETRDPHFLEAAHQIFPALVIGMAHHLGVGVAVRHGVDRSVLADGGGGHDAVLVDLHHLLHDGLRRHGVAQPPTGHGKGLGKSH